MAREDRLHAPIEYGEETAVIANHVNQLGEPPTAFLSKATVDI